MVSACILVQYQSGRGRDALKAVKKVKGVKRAFITFGRWDVVAEVEVPDLKTLGAIALKVNGLRGVRASETLVGL